MRRMMQLALVVLVAALGNRFCGCGARREGEEALGHDHRVRGGVAHRGVHQDG